MNRPPNGSANDENSTHESGHGVSWRIPVLSSARGTSSDDHHGAVRHRSRSVSRLQRASLARPIPAAKLGFPDEREKLAQDEGNGPQKLGSFSGVFVPTTLNVLSILMFLRFGFVLGQSGVLGMMAMLVISYAIDLITTMSISAIATNGTVRGGGAYYLISRSLGTEFGGSIGLVFYLGCVLNTGMNAVGLVDCFKQNFGVVSGSKSNFLYEGFWWEYLWATIILTLCTAICLAGSSVFSRASNGLLVILLVATFSIPLSACIKQPFKNERLGIEFTGFSSLSFFNNLYPQLTKGAAGSQIKRRENFQDLFGILFPATSGIFAGTSMSGDLKNPSRSIPKGTLYGLALTFFTYTIVILTMAASVTRESLYKDVNIIQDINISGSLIVLGEFSTSFFSSLMGIIGAAKVLQAIARDALLPGLSIFAKGTKKNDDPISSILITFVIAQVTIFADINQIASFVSMAYLMTFLVTNLACFLLKIGSAPNFRPSFRYFNSTTAFVGTVISGASMFFTDGVYATACVCVLVTLFLLIHYMAPPKTWGDVSQSLIYHQVRKYLLRLRPEHVKFWRPQILLFVNNFEEQYKMIQFCNSLKKGGLFVLGRVLVTDDFATAVPVVRKEQTAWNKFIEFSKVKAFINITAAPNNEWGVRNIVLSAGLGGMRPNVVVIDQFRKGNPDVLLNSVAPLRRSTRRASIVSEDGRETLRKTRTDSFETNPPMNVQSYLTTLEDLLFQLRINVAVARGFENIELPGTNDELPSKFIDLWPIQMSGEISSEGGRSRTNYLTTNFDTYTLILQLGCILNTVPSWKQSCRLRVAVFVEYETDVEEERGRVMTLLEKLRIGAEVLVFWLASGDLQTYRIIVNGDRNNVDKAVLDAVEQTLEEEDWWNELGRYRTASEEARSRSNRSQRQTPTGSGTTTPREGRRRAGLEGLKRVIESSRRRSIGPGVSLGMQTHRLLDSMVDYNSDGDESSSEESDSDSYLSESEGENEGEGDNPMAASDVPTVMEPEEIAETPTSAATPSPRAMFTKKGRVASTAKFSSAPIPATKVVSEEGTGPSIMFADSSPPRRGSPAAAGFESIYTRNGDASSQPALVPAEGDAECPRRASGYPSQAAIPLSFNDLPGRAQHLILNELIKSQSKDTAVVFTTLPTPAEGVSQDKASSEAYVGDLEVLCDGLPPCLLVHSNSVTVTMNL
ncbi:solute carrier family 12 member 3 [Nannizzia gypsea CBS 118893]|uniref:Solute carrier family 12 member 3 n=1 Tax=Arthroderma gypseum (strain ATCC MYA-4604 / CBS 118893) TaxID=535722 RepID=E4UVY8_ARTGP|nr:solute carrier family 12 member 3 [Nannizzia gypsea CBS 118893]EFR01649.1 solute carrier family 12 member 3 [Nannizzia gypsea CBS 118893]